VLDRYTGRILWSASAAHGFRHNAVCLGNGRLYAVDRRSDDHLSWLRRQPDPDVPNRLVAFDLASGKERWSSTAAVFGTWLSYSQEHDVLVEAGRVARDTLWDETPGMRAYTGVRGKLLWHHKNYFGPAMIRGRQVLKGDGGVGGSACDLLTGAPVLREDPLTGRRIEWRWTRTYGCNTPAGSQHLLTFRSGAAGYFDLCHDGGTANLGGFRSSCTNNLIVAGGLLSAPEYTRTCTCSYQNQTSLALVPMPEAEMWTFYGRRPVRGVVRRVGINLGAPGNRKADNGTLWLEYPSVGGPSPRLKVRSEPPRPVGFRLHAAQVGGAGPGWVVASGLRGLRVLRIGLGGLHDPERAYTVRLYFLEPDRLAAGRRRFHVALQGREVLRKLDVSKEAGGFRRGLLKEVRGVKVRDELVVALTPDATAPVGEPLLCGVEAVAEEW
jgi:hypothetical protein